MTQDVHFEKVERKIYPRTFLNTVFVVFNYDTSKEPEDLIERIQIFVRDNFNLQITLSKEEINEGGFSIDSTDGGQSYYFSRGQIGVKYMKPDYVSFTETMMPQIFRLVSFAKNVLSISSLESIQIRKVNVLNARGQGDSVISKSQLEHDLLSMRLIEAASPTGNYQDLYDAKQFKGVTDGDSFDIIYGFHEGSTPEGDRFVGLVLDESISKNQIQQLISVDKDLQDVNDKLFNMFHWSISTNMLAIMNKEL